MNDRDESPAAAQTQQYLRFQRRVFEAATEGLREGFQEGIENSEDNVASSLVTTSLRLSDEAKKLLDPQAAKIYLDAVGLSRTKYLPTDDLLLTAARQAEFDQNQARTNSILGKTTTLQTSLKGLLGSIQRKTDAQFGIANDFMELREKAENDGTGDNKEKIVQQMKIETVRNQYEMLMWFAVLVGTIFVGAKMINSNGGSSR